MGMGTTNTATLDEIGAGTLLPVTDGAGSRVVPAIAQEPSRLATNWMDRALVAQTYPGRPMTTHHVLDTDRPFDPACLRAAVDALVRSAPPLRSRIVETPLGLHRVVERARWTPLDALVTSSDVPVQLDAGAWLRRDFALDREEPFGVLASPRPGGGHQLVFTLHHGVTDGVGALALFDALLAHYTMLAGDGDRGPEPIPASSARFRDLLARSGGGRFALSLALDNLRRAGRFTDRRASLLEREDARAESLRYAVLDVSPSRWEHLRERARQLDCTRNDLMLAAFLRAASAWRRARDLPDEDFRALVPVDLRGPLGIGPSLGNHFGVAEADFTSGEVGATGLAHVVRARLSAARAPDRVMATPMAIAALGGLPPALRRSFFRWLDERAGSFMYSFLFSHIPVRAGLRVPASLGVRRMYCLSSLPRQPGVGLTITALPTAVTATLAYTPPRLSEAGARALLSHFGAALDAV
jgi:hypothetical protein